MKNNITLSFGNNLALLQTAFIVLKLCKVINWSWWLVLLPTIIPCSAVIIFLILWLIVKIFSKY